MPRGEVAEVGTRRVSQNGYTYERTEEKWELVHRMIAEEKLGRKLGANEYATFADGNKENLKPENIIVQVRGRSSLRRRIAQVDDRIRELTALREQLQRRLDSRETQT